MAIDPTSFLHEEVMRTKRRLEKALEAGNTVVAARLARRAAELLRELARYRSWGRQDLLDLAREYEELAARLEAGSTVVEGGGGRGPPAAAAPAARPAAPAGSRRVAAGGASTGRGVESEAAKLDLEFEAEAEKLIVRADVTWDDIAGLEDVKKALMEAIYYSIARPEEPVRLEPPRRFLLFGPPGTGKTMLAMAASNMLKATFLSVSVDRVLSRYVGDSPRMISAIFRVAYRRAPALIFFDEVEALVARRDSGREAATGLVQTFLTELDGFKSKKLDKPVIVIAATNKPWMLDEAILSRFEKRIYIPLPDKRAREEMFRLHLEKRGFEVEGITYEELAELTEGYSGRDIRNVCQEAIMMMLRRANPDIYERLLRARSLEELSRQRYRVEPIRREELLEAIRRVKPAVGREEIRRYEEWARQYASW